MANDVACGNDTGRVEVEEGEAVFIRDSITNEDLPNAHQAQHRPTKEEEIVCNRKNREGSAQYATRETVTQIMCR